MDTRKLPWAVGEDLAGLQPTIRLGPPNAIVGLLELALLSEIQYGEHTRPTVTRARSIACNRLKRFVSIRRESRFTGMDARGMPCALLTLIHRY